MVWVLCDGLGVVWFGCCVDWVYGLGVVCDGLGVVR